MITRSMFVLAVPNLETSCTYYRDVLGFDVREMGDDGWRMLVRDGCRIMAGECADAIAPGELGDHSYFGYFVVDDIDTYCARVTERGAEIIKPLRDEPWGMREFAVRTVDGHRVTIGQERAALASDAPDAAATTSSASAVVAEPPIGIVDLNYVSLYFDRYDDAVAFYSSIFGAPGYHEDDVVVGWKMGATWLTVFRGSVGPHKGSDPRNTEFAVQVATPADVDRLTDKLIAAGAKQYSAPSDTRMYEPMRFACLDDPFGVRLDVYCPLPHSPEE